MYTEGFIKILHQNRVTIDDIVERKMSLFAAFPTPSKNKPNSSYYTLYLRDIETGNCVLFFCGAKSVVEKLSTINHLHFQGPLTVEFKHESVDGGRKFIDIFFHEIDTIAKKLADSQILAEQEKPEFPNGEFPNGLNYKGEN